MQMKYDLGSHPWEDHRIMDQFSDDLCPELAKQKFVILFLPTACCLFASCTQFCLLSTNNHAQCIQELSSELQGWVAMCFQIWFCLCTLPQEPYWDKQMVVVSKDDLQHHNYHEGKGIILAHTLALYQTAKVVRGKHLQPDYIVGVPIWM